MSASKKHKNIYIYILNHLFINVFIHSLPSLQLLIEEHGIDIQALFINTV